MKHSQKSLRSLIWPLLALLIALTACRAQVASGPTATPFLLTRTQPAAATPAAEKSAGQVALTPSPTELPSPTPTHVPLHREVKHIAAPSLAGNLLGDPDKQYIEVYLPPSYDSSDLRYPVVYFLPGFGSGTDGNNDPFRMPEIARRMETGELPEMILVSPNGANLVGGSFYVNSPVTGNWEDFIVKDVVGYVDDHYRTIKSAGGRGISGHSMGGFAAINLAMRHPDIFSTVYCISGALLGDKGIADFHVLNPEKRVQNFLKIIADIQAMDVPDALKAMGRLDGPNAIAMAYGTAFAPDPELGPPYFDYPYTLKDGALEKVPDAWARWQAGMGDWDQKIEQYHANLSKLRGVLIEYGTQDYLTWIQRGSEYVYKTLTKAGIKSQLNALDAGHGDQLENRIVEEMLPFFGEKLDPAK
jgi:S-formylglutathione hydrolase